MTLIHCPECKQEISNKAPYCIYCGYPFAQEDTKDFSSIAAVSYDNEENNIDTKEDESSYCVNLFCTNRNEKILAMGFTQKLFHLERSEISKIAMQLAGKTSVIVAHELSEEQANEIVSQYRINGFNVTVVEEG